MMTLILDRVEAAWNTARLRDVRDRSPNRHCARSEASRSFQCVRGESLERSLRSQ
jgi:hypothetical protein